MRNTIAAWWSSPIPKVGTKFCFQLPRDASTDFLNQVCTNIMHLTPIKTLVNYTGNYDMFLQTKAENEVNQIKKHKKEQEVLPILPVNL